MSRLQSIPSCEYWRSQMLCIVCCCGFGKPFFLFSFLFLSFAGQWCGQTWNHLGLGSIPLSSTRKASQQCRSRFLCSTRVYQTCGKASARTSQCCWFIHADLLTESRATALVNYFCTCSVFMLFFPSLGQCTYVFNTLSATSREFSECLTNSTMQGVGSTEIREAWDNTGGWRFSRSGSVLCIDSLVHCSTPLGIKCP